jgi:DNA end-binding protein Ku
MPRAIWKGAISFGLVTIPVQLSTAVRRQRPRFHLLHGKDRSAVRYDRVCQKESRPVSWPEIVKGFEYEKGHFAVLTKEDFAKAALEKSDAIDVLAFVPAGAIDPRYFQTSYYLVPERASGHAYALLREAVRETEKVGVAQIILRQEQHLAALWVKDHALVLTLLRFEEEMLDPSEVQAPERKTLKASELEMAAKLIDSFAGPWKPEQYRDRYTANLMSIIKAKSKGQAPRLAAIGPTPPSGNVADLMERLRESLRRGRRAPRASPARASRRHGKASGKHAA